MGSRAVVVVCRDAEVAARRFGVADSPAAGDDRHPHRPAVLHRRTPARSRCSTRSAPRVTAAGLWDELATDWLVLDAELLPWSAKAEELLRTPVRVGRRRGDARRSAAEAARARPRPRPGRRRRRPRWRRTAERRDDGRPVRRRLPPLLLARRRRSTTSASRRSRCSPARARSTPSTDHLWHLDVARPPRRRPTRPRSAPPRTVDGRPRRRRQRGGGHRLVGGAHRRRRRGHGRQAGRRRRTAGPTGLTQPGIKCRGPRVPPHHLRARVHAPRPTSTASAIAGLGHKRSLALREFALGIEALERFVAGEPLYRVHECVFGVLALESEPVDPRL